jgi:cellulose synthase operon protein C
VRAVASVILAGILSLPMLCGRAVAQDDWSIQRERPAPRRPSKPRRPARPSAPRGGQEGAASGDRSEVLLARYHRVLESKPDDAFALQRLMDLYRERDGHVDALVAQLEERRAEDAHAYGPRLILGQVHERNQRAEAAAAAYAEAAAVAPKEPAPRVALGRLKREAGELAEARRLIEEALEHTAEPAERRERLRELGQVALDQGDHASARGYYGRLAKGAKGSVYLRTEYARALGERGEHGLAVDEYRRVVGQLGGDRRVLPPILRDLGRALLAAGRPDEALETLDRAIRLTPSGSGLRREIYDVMLEAHRGAGRLDELAGRLAREARGAESLELLGRVHDELGNEAEALAAYRRVLRMSPRQIDTRVRVIQLLSRSGKLDEVIREYRTLIRLSPREPRFVVELAQLLMQVGRRDEAMRLAEQTGRRHPRDASVHKALAELYGRWGEDELALRAIRTLVRIDPRDPSHLIVLGSQQLAAGDRKAAIATWRRILSADPNRARAHATLGGVLADHDLLDEAEEAYRQAVELAPEAIDPIRGLAGVLERPREQERRSERQARDAEAVKLWTRVLELADGDRAAQREARQRIVAVAGRRDQLGHRTSLWQQAFAADPPDLDAGRFLAEAYLRQRPRRLEKAERVLERIVELAPGDVESLATLERVRVARGDVNGAIEVLERLVEADPRKAPHYLSRMAEHSLSLYRDEDAVRYAEMAVQRTPDDATAHRRLGDLYRARQDVDRAIASYRRAIDLDERRFGTHFDLAELHLARGAVGDADRLLRQVVRASPDDDLVARAARAAIQIHMGSGTLAELERDWLPLALAHPRRPVFRRLLVELQDALARPWIHRVRQGGEGAARARTQLRELGQRALKPLLEALGDPDPAQRRIAVTLLGHLDNPNAAGPLLAAADNDKIDADLRAEALAAAGALAPAAMAPRFAALARGTERRLRATAAWSLARMGGRRAVAAMRELLVHADPAVRAFAAIGLARAGDGVSVDPVARMAREDRNLHAQAAAVWALGRMGDEAHLPLLLVALDGRSDPVARAAAAALGRIGGAKAMEALAGAVFDAQPARRVAAAHALVWLRAGNAPPDPRLPVPVSAEAVDRYLERLMASERQVHPGDVALRPLLPVLRDAASEALSGPVEQVQAVLRTMLPLEDGVEAEPKEETSDWPPSVAASARRLGVELAQGLVPELASAAAHPDPEVRERALHVLARLDDPAAAVALRDALTDDEASVVRGALAGIGREHGAALEGLASRVAHLLEHADWSVRMEAARTLGRMRAPDTAGALRRALVRDRYAFVREAAALALGQLGVASARGALEQAASTDPEPRVRRAARAALEDKGSD